MRYDNYEIDPALQGVGSLGETRRASDGSLYQWIETVDGLGNPVGGFWSKLKKIGKTAFKAAKIAAPLASKFVPYGNLVQTGLKLAQRSPLRKLARRGLRYARRHSRHVPVYGRQISRGLRYAQPYLRRAGLSGYPAAYQEMHGLAASGAGEEIGAPGELRQDDAGNAYEWVEGIDGLGNVAGGWQPVGSCHSGSALGDAGAPETWIDENNGALHRIEGYEPASEWEVRQDPDDLEGLAQPAEVFVEEPLGEGEMLYGPDDDGIPDGPCASVEGYLRDNSTDSLGAFVTQEPNEMPEFVDGPEPTIWRPLW